MYLAEIRADKVNEYLINKAKGAFIGLAIGDAMGVHTEGMTPENIAAKYGYITDFIDDNPSGSDDTEFALFNSLLLLKYGRGITSMQIADAWRKEIWRENGTYKGAGFSELMALENLSKGIEPPQSGFHAHSWSDGLAMRVAPFGIINAGKPDEAARLAYTDGCVTHSGEGIYCGQAVAAAIAAAMNDFNIEDIFSAAMNAVPLNSWCYRAVFRGIDIGFKSSGLQEAIKALHDELALKYYQWADVGPEAVGLSFGIIAASRGVFDEAVPACVNIGRDTDTIAAIAGAILGAKIGYDSIPEKWREKQLSPKGLCIPNVKGMDIAKTAGQLMGIGD